MSRTLKWVLMAGAVLAAGGIAFWRVRAGAEKPVSYVTATVERGSVVGKVTATGTLSALVTVQVGTQVSGRLKELFVDFNSPVKKGQVLAKIDPELFEAALAQSRANEQAAEGNLAKAKAQAADSERKLGRAKQLADQKLIAQADYDAALADSEMSKAGIQAAEGSLAQARAQRHQAEVNLSYTVIYSPIDGTVVSRAIDVGQTVAASLAAPTLFTIAENLSRMQVDTNVAEADVGKLKEGLDTMFTVDAFSNRPFRGRIRQIRFAPQVVSNVVTYDAVIDVDNPELLLRPGMTANVTFVYARVDDVLRVPNAALRFRLDGASPGAGAGGGGRGNWPGRGSRPANAAADGGADASPGEGRRPRPDQDGGAPFERGDRAVRNVFVLRQNTPVAVPVHTGITDGSFTEVTGGVEEGDLVITDRQGDGASKPSSSGPAGGPPGGMRRMF